MKTYLHGTLARLDVGDYLLPAQTLGLPPLVKTLHQPRYSPLWVYLTTREDYARVFAQDTGWVYRARPVGPVERDPDARGAVRCRRAVVVAVVRGPGSPAQAFPSLAGPLVPPGALERPVGGS